MKSWLQDNDLEMYLTYNEGKSVVTERLVRTLKNKIYIWLISIYDNIWLQYQKSVDW